EHRQPSLGLDAYGFPRQWLAKQLFGARLACQLLGGNFGYLSRSKRRGACGTLRYRCVDFWHVAERPWRKKVFAQRWARWGARHCIGQASSWEPPWYWRAEAPTEKSRTSLSAPTAALPM